MGAGDLVTRREILNAVAAGTLPPAEAAALLSRPGEPAGAPARLQRLSVQSAYRYVRLVGDESVDHVAVVSGQHGITRQGGVLRLTDLPVPAALAFAAAPTADLMVRVNPRLDVEVDIIGGRLVLENFSADLQVTVKAGSATLVGISGRLRLEVLGGSVTVAGTPSAPWRIDAESASVVLRLGADADATITPAGRHSNLDVHGQSGSVTLGKGTHAVAIDVAFSDLHVV